MGVPFRVCRSPLFDDSIWRFADALIWNWLIAGTDAHAKNYSLLLAQDRVRFAPIYHVA
jgi:serine/threonine-protein kinase HipA